MNDAYVVRIGAYQTKTKALSLLRQLKMTYKDAFLIKYTIDKQQIMQGSQLADPQKAKKTPNLPSTSRMAKRSDIPKRISEPHPHFDGENP